MRGRCLLVCIILPYRRLYINRSCAYRVAEDMQFPKSRTLLADWSSAFPKDETFLHHFRSFVQQRRTNVREEGFLDDLRRRQFVDVLSSVCGKECFRHTAANVSHSVH